MKRYPIVSLDYKRAKRLLGVAEGLLARFRSAREALKALHKECQRIDAIGAEYAPDADELFEGEFEGTQDVAPDLEGALETLDASIKLTASDVTRLARIAEQAEAWEKHFRRQWQEMFDKALEVRMTNDEADAAFLRALADTDPTVRWGDSNGVITLDLDAVFEKQSEFEADEEL